MEDATITMWNWMIHFVVNSILYLNSSGYFHVEYTPNEYKKLKQQVEGKKSPKKLKKLIPKLNKCTQIKRKVVGLEYETSEMQEIYDQENRSKRAHQVRGYFRKLKSERYTKMRGKSILINPHWRGLKKKGMKVPEPSELKKRIYEVDW